MNNKTIYPTTEIMTSFLSTECKNNESLNNNIKANPAEAILALTNLDMGDIDVHIVENNDNEVNIALPYYEQIESLTAEILSDANIGDISAGEILASLAFVFGSIGAALGFGATIITASAGVTGFTGAAVAAGVGFTAAAVGATVAATGAVAGIGAGVYEGAKAIDKGK